MFDGRGGEEVAGGGGEPTSCSQTLQRSSSPFLTSALWYAHLSPLLVYPLDCWMFSHVQVLGIIGALDPHTHKLNQASLSGEGKLEKEGVRPLRQGAAAAAAAGGAGGGGALGGSGDAGLGERACGRPACTWSSGMERHSTSHPLLALGLDIHKAAHIQSAACFSPRPFVLRPSLRCASHAAPRSAPSLLQAAATTAAPAATCSPPAAW